MNSKEITAFTGNAVEASGRTTLGRFGIKNGGGRKIAHRITKAPLEPLTGIGESENAAAVDFYPLANTMITLTVLRSEKLSYVRIWDMDRCMPVRIIRAHEDNILHIAKSFDTAYFATSGCDGVAKVFSMADGSLRAKFDFGGALTCVSISGDSRVLASWNNAGVAFFGDITSGGLFKTIETGFVPDYISIASDGRLVTAIGKNSARIYDIFSGKLVKTFNIFQDEGVNSGKVRPHIVTAGDELCYVAIEGEEAVVKSVFGDRCIARCAHGSKIMNYGVNTKNTLMMLTSDDDRTSVWELGGYTRVGEVSHSAHDGYMLISSNGRHLFVFHKHYEPTVRIDMYNIRENRLDASIYILYRSAFDFCVTTPPDETAASGWVNTNRPEMLETYIKGEYGCADEILSAGDPERLEYINSINRPDMVLARVNDFGKYMEMLGEIKRGGKVRSILNRRNSGLKQLESGAAGEAGQQTPKT